MPLHQYDPNNVTVVFGGALIDGFADGSFVNVEYNNDLFSLSVGADGEASRSKSNDRSARVTVTLMPGSTGNLILNAAIRLDEATNGGVVPLLVTDLSTGTTFAAEGCWVTKDPGSDFQTEAQTVEWVLETDRMIANHGAAA